MGECGDVDWHSIHDDVKAWILATKEPASHASWARIARKKSLEHWRAVIGADAAYKARCEPAPVVVEQEETAVILSTVSDLAVVDIDIVAAGSKAPVPRRKRAPTPQPRQTPLAVSMPPPSRASPTAQAAAERARQRWCLHGKATAHKQAAVAAASVHASEQVAASGCGSLRRASPQPLDAAAAKRLRTSVAIEAASIVASDAFKAFARSQSGDGLECIPPATMTVDERMRELRNTVRQR